MMAKTTKATMDGVRNDCPTIDSFLNHLPHPPSPPTPSPPDIYSPSAAEETGARAQPPKPNRFYRCRRGDDDEELIRNEKATSFEMEDEFDQYEHVNGPAREKTPVQIKTKENRMFAHQGDRESYSEDVRFKPSSTKSGKTRRATARGAERQVEHTDKARHTNRTDFNDRHNKVNVGDKARIGDQVRPVIDKDNTLSRELSSNAPLHNQNVTSAEADEEHFDSYTIDSLKLIRETNIHESFSSSSLVLCNPDIGGHDDDDNAFANIMKYYDNFGEASDSYKGWWKEKESTVEEEASDVLLAAQVALSPEPPPPPTEMELLSPVRIAPDDVDVNVGQRNGRNNLATKEGHWHHLSASLPIESSCMTIFSDISDITAVEGLLRVRERQAQTTGKVTDNAGKCSNQSPPSPIVVQKRMFLKKGSRKEPSSLNAKSRGEQLTLVSPVEDKSRIEQLEKLQKDHMEKMELKRKQMKEQRRRAHQLQAPPFSNEHTSNAGKAKTAMRPPSAPNLHGRKLDQSAVIESTTKQDFKNSWHKSQKRKPFKVQSSMNGIDRPKNSVDLASSPSNPNPRCVGNENNASATQIVKDSDDTHLLAEEVRKSSQTLPRKSIVIYKVSSTADRADQDLHHDGNVIDVDHQHIAEEKLKNQMDWLRKRQESALVEAEKEKEAARLWAATERASVAKFVLDEKAAIDRERHKALNNAILARRAQRPTAHEKKEMQQEIDGLRATLQKSKIDRDLEGKRYKLQEKGMRRRIYEQRGRINELEKLVADLEQHCRLPKSELSSGKKEFNNFPTSEDIVFNEVRDFRNFSQRNTSTKLEEAELCNIAQLSKKFSQSLASVDPSQLSPCEHANSMNKELQQRSMDSYCTNSLKSFDDSRDIGSSTLEVLCRDIKSPELINVENIGEKCPKSKGHVCSDGSSTIKSRRQNIDDDGYQRLLHGCGLISNASDVRNCSVNGAPETLVGESLTKGAIQRTYADGRKVILYQNKSCKEIFPDGRTTVIYANGDKKISNPLDGMETYYYAESLTTHTAYSNGVQIFEFANKQVEQHFPDGKKEITYSDSTRKIVHTNGIAEIIYPDGTRVVEDTDDMKYISMLS